MARGVTFAEVAEEWFERNEPRWVESYSSRLKMRLQDDLVPKFGSVPIDQVEPLEVLDAIRAIEKRGAVEMASRPRPNLQVDPCAIQKPSRLRRCE